MTPRRATIDVVGRRSSQCVPMDSLKILLPSLISMNEVSIVLFFGLCYQYCLGYFHPRRRTEADLNIVSNIPFLTAKHDCHINVELSFAVSLFNYLYKYFYKGPAGPSKLGCCAHRSKNSQAY